MAALAASLTAGAAVPALMPLPAKLEMRAGKLTIDGTFGVAGDTDGTLAPAVARFTGRLWRQTGLVPDPVKHSTTLRIACAPCDAALSVGVDESYTLDVTPSRAELKSTTMIGALHGLETFLQLIQPGAGGFEIPAVHIEDGPRFPWRGLLLDPARHFLPVAVIERNLDAMAAVKLNVFHWHLSDDQGFRAESLKYPRLQEFGSDGQFYTQAEMRAVVAYAAARGIRVIPEFDIPGHTESWFPGYPELAAGSGPFEIGRHFGVFDPVLDPSRDEIYTFLDGFLGEMAAIFPDPYFHIGGDEVDGKAWKESARVQAWAKEHDLKDTLPIQTYFNQRILKILQKYGKTMVGWDEILGPDLPEDAVIQSWRGAESLAKAAQKGHRGILSAGYYLDHARTAAYHYAVDPLSGPAAQLTPEQSARILGGEACMWTELADAETVDSRVWPRLAAIAERLWSPRQVNDVDSMYARLEVVSRGLEWVGVRHRSNQGEMLARLAGDGPIAPLRVLAGAVEARGLGTGRHAVDTLMPLNRLVDAVPPESETVRHAELLARAVAEKRAVAAEVESLRAQFAAWAANDVHYRETAADNALLAETKPLSKDLAELGAMGLAALRYQESGKRAPVAWLAAQSKEIARMQKPSADVLLAAFRPVKILIDALAKRK